MRFLLITLPHFLSRPPPPPVDPPPPSSLSPWQTVDTDTVLGALATQAAAAPVGDAMGEADVAATWDLVYAAPAPIASWRYIPVQEWW